MEILSSTSFNFIPILAHMRNLMKPIFYVSNIHFWFKLYNRPVKIASEVGKIRTKMKFS